MVSLFCIKFTGHDAYSLSTSNNWLLLEHLEHIIAQPFVYVQVLSEFGLSLRFVLRRRNVNNEKCTPTALENTHNVSHLSSLMDTKPYACITIEYFVLP